jgi:hypothetical protein
MARTQINGEQLQELIIVNQHVAAAAGIETSKLEDALEFIFRDGSVAFTGDVDFGTNKLTNVADGTVVTDGINLGQLNAAISAIASGLEYVGPWDASTTAYPTDPEIGNFYIITVDGTIDGVDFKAGDHMVANQTVVGATTSTHWDKIDNSHPIIDDDTMATASPTTTPSSESVKAYVDNQLALTFPTFVDGATPTGTIDHANTTFTVANAPIAGSFKLYHNGLRLKEGAGFDYTLSGTTVSMTWPPKTGTWLMVDYRYASV